MNMDDGEYTDGRARRGREALLSFSWSSSVALLSSPSRTDSCISNPPSATFFAAPSESALDASGVPVRGHQHG